MASIHILGSGTCWPPAKGKRRAHPGFLIRWGEDDQHLLLECSQNIAERLEKIGINPSSIRNLAVSHAHPDHFALPHFIQTALCCGIAEPGFSWDTPEKFPHLALYLPNAVVGSLETHLQIYFEEAVEPGKPTRLPFPILNPIVGMSESRVVDLHGAQLQSFPVAHGFAKVDALAFRLTLANKSIIAYSGDCGECPGVIEAARDADVFICEASARIGDEKGATGYGHLNPRQAGKIAKAAGVKKLVLTHYPGFDTNEALRKDCKKSGFTGEILIAKDGAEFYV